MRMIFEVAFEEAPNGDGNLDEGFTKLRVVVAFEEAPKGEHPEFGEVWGRGYVIVRLPGEQPVLLEEAPCGVEAQRCPAYCACA